ncbi:MAG: GNAT family N-acetyltransferase [Vicingaceae bacterium]
MPFEVQTGRLLLRDFSVSDADSMFALNSDPEVIKYTGDPPFASISEARAFLNSYSHYSNHGYGRWAVERIADQRFIGWSGLKLNEEQNVDLGFRFLRSEWNKGYATESALACLEIGFDMLGLEEIVGRVVQANIVSIRVLEKIEMIYDKRAPCDGLPDALHYRISKSDWIRSGKRVVVKSSGI